jgi:radical SAM protein with 4Fe4S-binding SPASM domain
MKLFYIKTTETCNLNCKHCFTNGINGAKIYFNPIKTAQWVNQFKEEECHLEYHGGEPFLAPLEDLYTFYNNIEIKNVSFGMTTNLTFKLTKEKLRFIDEVLNKRIGTSWDEGIRWSNDKQYALWKKNVRYLTSNGYTIKLFISINKELIFRKPEEILLMIKELGITEVAFERLTHDGSALRDLSIFPTNKEIDDWIYDLHLATLKLGAREWLDNALLESIYDKFDSNLTRESTFCRDCEQKLFTINADGTVAGCPNSAPTDYYSSIDQPKELALSNPKRVCMIATEVQIDIRCTSCEVFDKCGGDCYKLEWDSQCPAPKKLMYGLNNKTNRIM